MPRDGLQHCKTLVACTASAAVAGWLVYRLSYLHRSQQQQRQQHKGCKCQLQQPSAAAASDATIPAGKGRVDPADPSPRDGYLGWDDYFMAIAFLSAQRSKDPNKQVGACIVSIDHVILGIGYNGFPRGCPDDRLPWAKVAASGNPLDTKYPYVCHAEMNALLNKNAASVDGARVYVTMFPCNECSKLLIQAGIKEIIYSEDKSSNQQNVAHSSMLPNQAYEASRRLLKLAGVKYRQHTWQRPLQLRLH